MNKVAANQIDKLWEQLQDAISAAYKARVEANEPHDERSTLSDYSDNGRDLRELVEAETANERQHRKLAYTGWIAPFSASTAAKLILLGNIVDGAERDVLIPATFFLELRKTACEAMVIGYVVREFLTAEFRESVKSLDYAKLMK